MTKQNQTNKSNAERVDQAYTEWASSYDKYARLNNMAIRKVHPAFDRMLKKEAEGKVGLDLGCGTGLVTQIASKYAKEIIGIDRNKAMLNEANEKTSLGAKMIFIQEDMTEKLDFPDQKFDFVISSLAINHIENIEPVFNEVYRVLKPGGFFIFDEPDSGPRTPEQLKFKARPKVIDPLLKHKDQGVTTWYFRPLEEVTRLLTKTGFSIEKITEEKYDEKIKDIMENYEYHKDKPFFRIIKARKNS